MACHLECYESCVDLGRRSKFIFDRRYCSNHTLSYIVDENRSGNNHFSNDIQCPDDINCSKATLVQSSAKDNSSFNNDSYEQSQSRVSKISSPALKSQQNEDPNPQFVTLFHKITCWAFGWHCKEESVSVAQEVKREVLKEKSGVTREEFVPVAKAFVKPADPAAEHYVDPCESAKTKTSRSSKSSIVKQTTCAKINYSQYRSFPLPTNKEHHPHLVAKAKEANRRIRSRSFSPTVLKKKVCKNCGVDSKNNPGSTKKKGLKNKEKDKKKPESSPGSTFGSRPVSASIFPQPSTSPSTTVILTKQTSKSPVREEQISDASSPQKGTVPPDSDEGNEDVLPYVNDDAQSRFETDTLIINEIPSTGEVTKTKTNETPPAEQVINITSLHFGSKYENDKNSFEINETVPAEPNIITKSVFSSTHPKAETTKYGCCSDRKDDISSIDNRSVLSSLCQQAEKICKGLPPQGDEERPYVPGSFFPNKSILENIKFLPRLKKRKRSKTSQKSSSKRHKTRCSRSTPGIQIVFYPDDPAPAMCSSFPNIVPKDRFRSQSLSSAPPNCAPPNCFQCSVCMKNCGPECSCVICKILNADKKGSVKSGNKIVTRRSKSVERNNKKSNITKTNRRSDKCKQGKCGGELNMSVCAQLCPGIAGQKQCSPYCRPSSSICTPTCGLDGMSSNCVYSGLGTAYERSMKEDSYCKSLLAKYTLKSPYYECMKPSPATMGCSSYASAPQMSYGPSCIGKKDKKEKEAKTKPKSKAPEHDYEQELHVNNSRTKSATPEKVQVHTSKLKANISYSEKPKEIDAYKEVQLNNGLKCFDPPPIIKHKGIASPVHLFRSLKKVEDPPKKNEQGDRKESLQRTRSKSPIKNKKAKNKNNGALEFEDDEEYMHFRGRLANNFCRESCQKSKTLTFHRFDRTLTRLTSIDNFSLSEDEFEMRFSPPSTQSCQNNNFGEENFRFFRKYLRITPSTSTAHTATERSSAEESLRQDMLEDARQVESNNQFSENNVVSETFDEDKVEEKIARLDDWILGNYPEGFSMTTGKKTLQKKKSTQGISASSKKKGSTRPTQRKKTAPVQNRIGRSADVEAAKRILTINPSDLIKNRSPQRSNPVLNDIELDNALDFESPRKNDIMYTDSPVLPPPEHYTPQYSMEENFTERSDYFEDDYMNEQLQMLPQRGGEGRFDSGVKDELWKSGAPNDVRLGFRKPSETLSSPVSRKESGTLPDHGSMPNNGYRRDMQKSPQKDNQALKNNSPRRQRDLSVTKREDVPPLEEDKDIQEEGDTSTECKESCVDGMEYAHTKKESGDESIQESTSLTQSLFSKLTSMLGVKSRKTVSEFALKAVPSEHILQGQESSVDIDQKLKENPLPTSRSRSMRLIRDGSSNNDYVDRSPECVVEEIGEDIDADSDLALRFSSITSSGSSVFKFHESAGRNMSLNRGGCSSEEDVRDVPSCESQVTRDSVCSPAVSGPITASSVTTACSATTCSGVSFSSSCVTSTASSATTLCDGMSPRWQPVGANGPHSLTAKVASMNLQQLLGPSPGITWSKVENDCDVTAIKEAKERFMQLHRRKKAGATAKAAEETLQKESKSVESNTSKSMVKGTDEATPQEKVDKDSVESKAITHNNNVSVVSAVKAGAESGDAPSDKLNEINATEDADKDTSESVVDQDEAVVGEQCTPVDKATEELVLGTVNKESPFMEDVSGIGAGSGSICTQP